MQAYMTYEAIVQEGYLRNMNGSRFQINGYSLLDYLGGMATDL